MATAVTKINLGRYQRLFVAEIAAPATDADYAAVVNENQTEVTQTANNESIDTKANGGETVTIPGTISYSLSVTIDEIYEDEGLALILANLNKVAKYQVRDMRDESAPKVYIEGNFLLTEIKETDGAKGATQHVLTLQGAGGVKFNRPTRALV